jgi:hypothetical protein
VAASNVNQAKGTFDGADKSYQIGANDQLLTSDQYKPLVVAYKSGAPIHLSDIANVIDDTENVKQAAWMNDVPAVILNIQRQPGANIIAVVDRVKQLLPQLRASLPSAVEVTILTDRTTTIRASVHDVEFELMLVIALVVMVIFLFLRTLAATVIPSVAVPLSLVGTFGAIDLGAGVDLMGEAERIHVARRRQHGDGCQRTQPVHRTPPPVPAPRRRLRTIASSPATRRVAPAPPAPLASAFVPVPTRQPQPPPPVATIFSTVTSETHVGAPVKFSSQCEFWAQSTPAHGSVVHRPVSGTHA